VAEKDYYRLLGVEREASGEAIKRAFRKLVMEYHPDRNQGKPGYEEQIKDINEAYQVLGNEERRRQYDLLCRPSFSRHVYYEENLSEDLIEIIRVFSQRGLGIRGLGGCKARGFGRRCGRRWKEHF